MVVFAEKTAKNGFVIFVKMQIISDLFSYWEIELW